MSFWFFLAVVSVLLVIDIWKNGETSLLCVATRILSQKQRRITHVIEETVTDSVTETEPETLESRLAEELGIQEDLQKEGRQKEVAALIKNLKILIQKADKKWNPKSSDS